MSETEVKTRLTIEQSGDPQIIRDTAAAVRELAASLQTLQGAGGASLAPLLAELDQVITKANAAAAAVSQLTGK